MSQARKKRLLSLLWQGRENTRGHNSFFIIITLKDNTHASQNPENKHSKRQKNGSERHFSALYVIIEVSPLPPWMFTLHPTPPPLPNILPIPPPFNPPPLLGLGPWWWWSSSPHPHPSSVSIDKEGSDRVSGQEERFVSRNSYESGAGYEIQ